MPSKNANIDTMSVKISFLTPSGRFLARVAGPTKGNVVLRETQVVWSKDSEQSIHLAKQFLSAKLYNSRWVLERAIRDHPMRIDVEAVQRQSVFLRETIKSLREAQTTESLMGFEGLAAKAYFDVFNNLILRGNESFRFEGRIRRPPLDPINAMLSFTYTLLSLDLAAALETVGIDPYIGFLHQLRPGRKSLALDMLEELRAPVADRFVISLVNKGVVTEDDFQKRENGAVRFTEEGRKTFLAQWQKKKQEQITHPYLGEAISWGMVPYVQAMLLSRYMRGDIDDYPPFLWK